MHARVTHGCHLRQYGHVTPSFQPPHGSFNASRVLPAVRSRCSRRRFSSCIRAEDRGDSSTDGEESVESLFAKELKKRGEQRRRVTKEDLYPKRQGNSSAVKEQLPEFRQGDASASSDQLERSRKLNSEGLEGLIPRASELVKLGGSFWIAFWPFIALFITAFIAVYLLTGSGFIHGGNQRMAVPEYLPRDLFEEQPANVQESETAPVVSEGDASR